MDLDQGIHADFQGQGVEVGQLGIVQGGHYEQHGVGTHDPGIADIACIDSEVLAEHRNRDSTACSHQVVDRAAEVPDVGEDRQACRSAECVLLCSLGRVEVGGHIAPGGRTALHLGDDRRLAHRSAPQGEVESTGRRGAAGPSDKGVEAPSVR